MRAAPRGRPRRQTLAAPREDEAEPEPPAPLVSLAPPEDLVPAWLSDTLAEDAADGGDLAPDYQVPIFVRTFMFIFHFDTLL